MTTLKEWFSHTDKSISESCKIRPNFDYNYKFAIDLAPNGIPFGVPNQWKKWIYNPNLVWINKNQKKNSVCEMFLETSAKFGPI